MGAQTRGGFRKLGRKQVSPEKVPGHLLEAFLQCFSLSGKSPQKKGKSQNLKDKKG